jgi:hypothetical protein
MRGTSEPSPERVADIAHCRAFTSHRSGKEKVVNRFGPEDLVSDPLERRRGRRVRTDEGEKFVKSQHKILLSRDLMISHEMDEG